MAIKAVSDLPDLIQPLSDSDLLFITQLDVENEQYVSVKCPLGQLRAYFDNATNTNNLTLRDSTNAQLFAGDADHLTLINSAGQTIYQDED